MATSLKDSRVFILGGSSGMGFATAEMALAAGARVTIVARNEDRLKAAAARLGNKVEARVMDAGNDDSVAAFFQKSPEWDHALLSGGGGGRGKLSEMRMEDAFEAMNGKFWAYVRIAKHIKLTPGGSLTLISGGLGQMAMPGTSLIGAINGAIEYMTRGLALDFAPARVNTVVPGFIATEMWNRLPEAARQQMREEAETTLPVRRYGRAEDIAQAVIFAMTNPFITGSLVNVDGGSLLI